jgi:hypothetical protein
MGIQNVKMGNGGGGGVDVDFINQVLRVLNVWLLLQSSAF